jgi:hypothetical protein
MLSGCVILIILLVLSFLSLAAYGAFVLGISTPTRREEASQPEASDEVGHDLLSLLSFVLSASQAVIAILIYEMWRLIAALLDKVIVPQLTFFGEYIFHGKQGAAVSRSTLLTLISRSKETSLQR